MKKVLVTGAAGFIGFHLVKRLLKEGYEVIGLDNINDYYDVNLKYARLAETGIYSDHQKNRTGGKNIKYASIDFGKKLHSDNFTNYNFIRLNLEDKEEILKLFSVEQFDFVINLAAQAGVRYSLENPHLYIQSNIVGFLNILEACRNFPVRHLIYASSSSVYGENAKIPFTETDITDSPVSLYAATKKSNELMAYSYSHLYNIPCTGLRFFTVYGPWGRPDMAPILFANAISNGQAIKVFNNGNLSRDFTYIDDIIEGVIRVVVKEHNNNKSHEIFNIGCSTPIKLLDFINTLEFALEKKANLIMLPMQPGDVLQTFADTFKMESKFGYKPSVNLNNGIKVFVEWFKKFNLK